MNNKCDISLLKAVEYRINRGIRKENLEDNYSVECYLDDFAKGVIVSMKAMIYSKEEEHKTDDFQKVYNKQPKNNLELLKSGIYNYLPDESFFPVFFPVKCEDKVVAIFPYKDIRITKTFYPHIPYNKPEIRFMEGYKS